MTEAERLQRAGLASDILKNELFRTVIRAVRESMIQEWLKADQDNAVDLGEDVRRFERIVGRITETLGDYANDARMIQEYGQKK